MGKLLLNLEREIADGQKKAEKAKELYQLLSSYNAYCILLLKAKQEHERKNANIRQYYSDSNCYGTQINDLFTAFKKDECLTGIENTSSTYKKDRDRLFLIEKDTLLRLYSSRNMNSVIDDHHSVNYKILKIKNCKAKVYRTNIYCGDPYYCDTHCEKRDSFGLVENGKLISPNFVLDSQFRDCDNMDIREILKIQSLDEIYEKITEAKNIKIKKLVL